MGQRTDSRGQRLAKCSTGHRCARSGTGRVGARTRRRLQPRHREDQSVLVRLSRCPRCLGSRPARYPDPLDESAPARLRSHHPGRRCGVQCIAISCVRAPRPPGRRAAVRCVTASRAASRRWTQVAITNAAAMDEEPSERQHDAHLQPDGRYHLLPDGRYRTRARREVYRALQRRRGLRALCAPTPVSVQPRRSTPSTRYAAIELPARRQGA